MAGLTIDELEFTAAPVALVTGANRGIGREVARQLVELGYLVAAGARDPADGERTAAELDPGGERVLPVRLDVTDGDTVAGAVAAVAGRWGRLNLLVNNAAIHYDTWQRASNADLGVVTEALQTNTLGPWRTTLAALPLLRAAEHPRIVMVSSEGGAISGMTGGTPAYSVSKAGLNALTRLLAGELARDRILVNAVCPGWVRTDMGGAGGRPVSEGAASVLWAALLPDRGPSGGFFRDGRPLEW